MFVSDRSKGVMNGHDVSQSLAWVAQVGQTVNDWKRIVTCQLLDFGMRFRTANHSINELTEDLRKI